MPKLTLSAVTDRAKKINVNEAQALVGLITTGVTAADQVWKSVNADQRVTKAARKAFDGVASKATPRTSADKVDQKLAAIETYAAQANDPDEAERWLQTAKEARNRLPVIKSLSGRDRAKALKSLKDEVDATLKEITSRDLGTKRS